MPNGLDVGLGEFAGIHVDFGDSASLRTEAFGSIFFAVTWRGVDIDFGARAPRRRSSWRSAASAHKFAQS
jgi:hypothetical protein